jgi:hypothetical protein
VLSPPPLSHRTIFHQGSQATATGNWSGVRLAYLSDPVDGFENRSTAQNLSETMQEGPSIYTWSSPNNASSGARTDASSSASSDPYAYTPSSTVETKNNTTTDTLQSGDVSPTHAPSTTGGDTGPEVSPRMESGNADSSDQAQQKSTGNQEGATTFRTDGTSFYTPASAYSNPSQATYRDASTTDTTTPNYVKSAPEPEETPRNATVRTKEFLKGVGQGVRSLVSLPGLTLLAASVLLGALLPWTVPFLVLGGLGIGLFQVISGVVGDDWQQVGRGAFSLLGSLVAGRVLSDLFPIGGRDGLHFTLPGRSVEPLRFYGHDPFGYVNQWFPGCSTPHWWGGSHTPHWWGMTQPYTLTGVTYNIPGVASLVTIPGGISHAGFFAPTGLGAGHIAGGAVNIPASSNADFGNDLPTSTPSELMLAASSANKEISSDSSHQNNTTENLNETSDSDSDAEQSSITASDDSQGSSGDSANDGGSDSDSEAA